MGLVMDSSSVILLAGSMGVASLLLTILYFLHKCLMRETPYQRTFLLDEVDALMFKENDKKVVKKAKNSVRQRVISKPVEVPEKVASKESGTDKAALNAVQASDVRLTAVPEGVLGSSAQTWANGEKADVKKKNQNVVEKVEKVQHTLTAKPVKKSLEETPEVDSSRQLVSGKAALVGKDDKPKTKGTEAHASDVEQQQQLERGDDKKNQLKSKEVASSSRPAKELHAAKLGKELEENQELNPPLQTDKKKKNKKSNEEVSITEQKVKVEASSQVASLPSKPVVEEAIVEQRIKATMSAPLQPAANKKRNPKAKASEEFDVAEEIPVVQSEFKQKKAPSVEVQQPNKQQQNGNKASSDLDELKKLINEKDAIIQRDQLQFKSMNEALFQMKKELTTERSRFTELETNIHVVSQKHNEEKQTLLSSLHQKEQQSKQAIQLLQQELQSLKARPNDLSMIMSNLAEENAKLTAEISHAEKQRNEEINQRAKTMDLLNDAVRKLDHLELTNKSLEMKFKQADERARAMEMKQKEASDAVARMEKMYLDLQQEHQRLQMQGQPNLELQNQLRNAKVENEELHALVARLEKETSDLEKELKAAEDASIVSESIQQSQASNVTQVVNGCSDAGLLTQLESQLSEHEKTNKELVDKLNVTDKKNQTLEEERGELLIALEKLKKQVVDLEKELENKTIPNEAVVEQQNGCLESELAVKLEAIITEKEENCKELREQLELKDKRNEDLRQKNWKAMEALTESEKRLELTRKEQELQVKDLQNSIAELKSKLSQAEQKSLQVETVSVQEVAPVSRNREASECDKVKVGKTGEGNEDPEIENVKQLKLVAKANEICMTRQEDEIASLTQELLEQKNKNDKLREKNWTIMTSLNSAESKLQELYQKLEQTENQLNELKAASSSLSSSSSDKGSNTNEDVVRKEYTIVNEVNESCHWDMSQLVLDLDSKTAEIEILQSILDQHESLISILKTENDELRERSSKGGKELIELLEQKVEHYKKVLSDTESILRTLEASVDAEEKKWKTKVEKLEREVSALRQKAG